MPSDKCPLYRKHGAHGKVIALDLDDTIFMGYAFPEVGAPLPSVLSRLGWLIDRGCEIVIHTSRINSSLYGSTHDEQKDKIKAALLKHGLPAWEIWDGCGKPLACHYVDDKAHKTIGALVYALEWKDRISQG